MRLVEFHEKMLDLNDFGCWYPGVNQVLTDKSLALTYLLSKSNLANQESQVQQNHIFSAEILKSPEKVPLRTIFRN